MSDTFIADTPVGRLHRGDIVWYRRYNRVKRTIEIEWATASGRSTLNSRLLFARGLGRARCVGNWRCDTHRVGWSP